jgi:hypothetical protein
MIMVYVLLIAINEIMNAVNEQLTEKGKKEQII